MTASISQGPLSSSGAFPLHQSARIVALASVYSNGSRRRPRKNRDRNRSREEVAFLNNISSPSRKQIHRRVYGSNPHDAAALVPLPGARASGYNGISVQISKARVGTEKPARLSTVSLSCAPALKSKSALGAKIVLCLVRAARDD